MDDTAQNPQIQSQQMQPVGQQSPTVSPQMVQPPVTAGHPEAPARTGLPQREAASLTEADSAPAASDDHAAKPDEVSDAANVQSTEAAAIRIQEAHPQVEIAPELQKVDVKLGPDAAPEQREEVQLDATAAAQQPDTQSAASGISLASSPQQLDEVKKKSKIRDSLKWFAELLSYIQKKLQANSPKQETPVVEEVKQ